MKKIFFVFLAIVLYAFAPTITFANHLLGAELHYKYISTTDNIRTYQVTMYFYGDCASNTPGAAYQALPTANPTIKLYNGTSLVATQNLTVVDSLSNIEITPVCPEYSDSTTCININYSVPGITQFVYQGTFQLNGTSSNWRFSFEGQMSNNTNAGRSTIIGNANVMGGTTLMYMDAILNNVDGENNSPTFTSLPTPFFCINKPQNYSLGAVDADGDDMEYSLTPGQYSIGANAPPATNIGYNAPYNAANPIPTDAGDFVFNTTNGQMTFTPNLALNCLVVNTVNEYRNGTLVGTTHREMTFVVLQDCNNDAPEGPISNTENVSIVDVNGQPMFQVCAGQSATVQYDINSTDLNGDNVTVTWNALPAGANIIVDNNGTPAPVVHFLWNVTNAVEGDYTFYITYSDDGCPLASSQTLAYTLQVVPFPEEFTTAGTPPCIDESNGMVWLIPENNTGILYDYYWYDASGNTLLQTTLDDIDGDTLSNVASGVYTVKVVNPDGCRKFYSVTVPATEYAVAITSADTLGCTGSNMTFSSNSTGSINSWTWDFGDGSPILNGSATISHVYNTQGSYTVRLIGSTENGCTDSAAIAIYVDSPQHVAFTKTKDSLCVGDKVFFTPTIGANVDSLYWNFGGSWQKGTGDASEVSYVYDAPGVYVINLEVAYRACPDKSISDTVWVFPYPIVNLGPDTTLCLNGTPFILYNLQPQPAGYSYMWNTGDTTPSIPIVHPGIYSLTVASDYNCKTTDEAEIKKDCYLDIPNSFTPNNDGLNDYFLPRQLLSSGVVAFSMEVYDRWGQLIFKTQRVDGRGWDGTFNGKQQPTGVYVYKIDATLKNNNKESYTGNVSLLR